MSKKSEQHKLELEGVSKEVTNLIEKIKDEFTVDKDAHAVNASPNVFEKTLPEGMTLQQVNAVDDHRTDFIAASTAVVGEMALAAMADDKKATMYTSEVSIGGKNKLTIGVERTKSFENHLKKDGDGKPEILHIHGSSKIDVNFVAGRNVGDLKKVREALKTSAMAAFK